jgi:hypothetical protein
MITELFDTNPSVTLFVAWLCFLPYKWGHTPIAQGAMMTKPASDLQAVIEIRGGGRPQSNLLSVAE